MEGAKRRRYSAQLVVAGTSTSDQTQGHFQNVNTKLNSNAGVGMLKNMLAFSYSIVHLLLCSSLMRMCRDTLIWPMRIFKICALLVSAIATETLSCRT